MLLVGVIFKIRVLCIFTLFALVLLILVVIFLLFFFFLLIFLLHVLLLEVFLKVFHLLLSSSWFLLSGTSKKRVQGESRAGGDQEEREQHLEKFHFVLSCSAVAVLCVDQWC